MDSCAASKSDQVSIGLNLPGYKCTCTGSVAFKLNAHPITAQLAALDDSKCNSVLSLEEEINALQHATELLSVERCISIVQKCSERKNLELSRRLHMHICNAGLEALAVLGNRLVPLFVECESFSDAVGVFYTLSLANEHSWTAIIQGCMKDGKSDHALYLFGLMQDLGISPSKFTLMAVLRACTLLGYHDKGEKVHSVIIKEGLDCDSFLGTTLMVMYASCGLLAEARDVFERLLVRDVVSWNVLITGYYEFGRDEEALSCLEQMRLEGVSPNDASFVYTLKACIRPGDLGKGRALHSDIIKMGLEVGSFIESTLVVMYAKCGSFMEAEEVLETLQVQSVIAWTGLISAYADAEHGEEALDCLQRMKQVEIEAGPVASMCGLKACASEGAAEAGQCLHAEILKGGYEKDSFIGNSLVNMYAKCGMFAEAFYVFDNLPTVDVVTWNALISACAEHELCKDALACFEQMKLRGVSPNTMSYVCCLKACGCERNLDKARELHSDILKLAFEEFCLVEITLVESYTACGSLEEAQEVRDGLSALDIISWNSVIAAYVEHGQGVEALRCLEKLRVQGLYPDDVTFICSLKACVLLGAQNMAQELHTELVQEGFESFLFVGNCLVDMYMKFGFLLEAQDVFDQLGVRDVVTWTVLVAGYVEHNLPEEALKHVEIMELSGFSYNSDMYGCVLRACSSNGNSHRGFAVHTELILEGLAEDYSLGNILVDMYGKLGLIAEARDVFDELKFRDQVSWNTLMARYAEYGLFSEILGSLDGMKSGNVCPDKITYLCALQGCGSSEAIDQGRDMHSDIIKKGLDEDELIRNTLVDMYLKGTTLEEAQKVFDMTPCTIDIVGWNIMIRGFAHFGHLEHGIDCMKDMELGAVSPNAFTFICILRACCRQGALDIGMVLHSEILKEGFEMDPSICDVLLDMYSKCGCLVEAQELFDELTCKSVVSWNTLIAGYVDNGLAEEALNCLERMQQEGLDCDAITHTCGLKACSITGALDRGQSIHVAIILDGSDRDPIIGNALVNMYAKCGAGMDARAVFDELLIQDVVSWNTLLGMYAEHGGMEALSCLDEMHHEEVTQDVITHVCSLKACGTMEALTKGQEMHISIIMKGIDKDLLAGNTLVDMYAKCGALKEARSVLGMLPARDVSSWNALMAGLVDFGLIEEFHECLDEMQAEGLQPDSFTYVSWLIVCGGLGALNRGQAVHDEVARDGLDKHMVVGNNLVDMYGKCGSLVEARDVFEELVGRDVVSWTALLAGYAEHGHIKEALQCLKDMQLHGVSPNSITWNAAILGCAEHKEGEKARALFARMQEQCVLPTNVSFMSTLKACAGPAALEKGKRLHAQVHEASWLGSNEEFMMLNSIIHMYGQCRSMADAQKMFDELPSRCTISCNALMAGLLLQEDVDAVFELFESMRKEGPDPDDITFLSVLAACRQIGLLAKGQDYYAMMSKEYSIIPNMKHHLCMLDLFGSAGQLNQAMVMESMPLEVLWGSEIDACQRWGEMERGLQKVSWG